MLVRVLLNKVISITNRIRQFEIVLKVSSLIEMRIETHHLRFGANISVKS